jgi:hypothetical protein
MVKWLFAKHQGPFKQFVDRFYTFKPDKVAESEISVSLPV